MRPVSSPDHPIRRCFNHCPREGRDVRIFRRTLGNKVGPDQFGKTVVSFEQSQHGLKSRGLKTLGCLNAPKMINHDGDRQFGKFLFKLGAFPEIGIELQMPAEFLDPVCKTPGVFQPQPGRARSGINTNAAKTQRMKPFNLLVSNRLRHDGYASQLELIGLQGLFNRRVIGPINARLHEHCAFAADCAKHLDIGRQRALMRHEVGLGQQRETSLWSKDMRMTISGFAGKADVGNPGIGDRFGNVRSTHD